MMTMTSRSFGFLFLLLFIGGTVFGQSEKASVELTDLLNEFLAGAGRNDAAVHDKFWASDLIYTRSSGSRITKDELMKGVRSAPPQKAGDPLTIYSAEDVQIRTYGNVAVVAFKLVGKTAKADGTTELSEYFNTGTFVKRAGRWQAVAWQATAIPKPQTATTAAAPAPVQKPVKVPGRAYVRGPKGGCYYMNPSGKKTYVNKEFCS